MDSTPRKPEVTPDGLPLKHIDQQNTVRRLIAAVRRGGWSALFGIELFRRFQGNAETGRAKRDHGGRHE